MEKICAKCDIRDECESAVETEQVITISTKRYEELVEAEIFLDALKAAGVDNWEGYDIAQDIMNGEEII